MMIKSDRENYPYSEQQREDELIMATENGKADQIDHQDYQFGSNHVGKNRTNEEALLTFEDCVTRMTAISNPERSLDY
jgi:hypothetical protein